LKLPCASDLCIFGTLPHSQSSKTEGFLLLLPVEFLGFTSRIPV